MTTIMHFTPLEEGRPEFTVEQDENGYMVKAVSGSEPVTERRLRHLGQVLELVGNWMGSNDYKLASPAITNIKGKGNERRGKEKAKRSSGEAG